MVVLSKIYTRTGDKGDTALGNGTRVAKHALRVDAYGTSDELNATVGLARLHAEGEADAALARIQNDLFDLGADLATPKGALDGEGFEPGEMVLRIVDGQVEWIERAIDTANETLEPLTSFILPGGSEAAARLHVARASVRKAERAMTALAELEPVNPAALHYINRLSDLLFVLGRTANDHGKADITWTPGANR